MAKEDNEFQSLLTDLQRKAAEVRYGKIRVPSFIVKVVNGQISQIVVEGDYQIIERSYQPQD